MSNNTTTASSAILGTSPNTQQDYYIVRGLLREYGLASAVDPAEGFPLFPQAPPGYTHESKRPQIIVALVFIILVILLPTIARLVTRARNLQMIWGSDDWAIILAAVFAVLYPIFQVVIVARGGGGLHAYDVTYAQYAEYVYYGSLCMTIHYIAVGLIKISITLFLRRLVERLSLLWRISCDVFLGTLVVYVVYSAFSTSIYCSPASATWSLEAAGRLETPAVCFDSLTNVKALTVLHIVQGFFLLGSPVVLLWKVKMDKAKKTLLYVIWAVGGLTVLGGLFTILLGNVTTSSYDYTWTYTTILAWGSVNVCLGMLTANLPVLDTYILGAWERVSGLAGAARLSGPRKKEPSGAGKQSETTSPALGRSSFNGSRTIGGTPTPARSAAGSEGGSDRVELRILRTCDVDVRYSVVEKPESIEELIDRREVHAVRAAGPGGLS